MLPENLGHIFEQGVLSHPDAPVLIQHGESLTFLELDRRCNRLANGLRASGVHPRDRIVVMFGNDIRFIEALFACMRIGAIPVPANLRLSPDAIEYIVSDSGATAILAGRSQTALAQSLISRCKHLRLSLFEEGFSEDRPTYEGLIAGASADLERWETQPDDICMLPYTSGSTGKPKGIPLTHGGQIWNADCVRKLLLLDDSERALVAVPLFHKNAMVVTKAMLLAGGSVAVLPGFDAQECIRAISRWGITFMSGVPAMYKRILAEKDLLRECRLDTLRYALCGSAEVPQALLDHFTEVFGAPLRESYGLTEGGPVPLLTPRWAASRRGSCGLVFPGSEVRLVCEDGRTLVGTDEAGELLVRNPGVAHGYWNLPQLTSQRFRHGWLHTGDLMRRDADGYFYFLGRNDDVINVAGEKVHPKAVEDLLLRHPNVKDVCVVPAPHAEKGHVPVAFVCEWEKGLASESELKKFFIEEGAAFAHPRRIVFIDSLPLGSTGKVDRTYLKQQASSIT